MGAHLFSRPIFFYFFIFFLLKGPVVLSEIWAIFPFPNTICTGTISGAALFNILDYSTRQLNTDLSDRTLQVAGLKIVYNSQLPANQSRIISVDVWNHKTEKWKELHATNMYDYASTSYLCGTLQPYPGLLDMAQIGDRLLQDAVKTYMSQLPGPYSASLDGRLVDDGSATQTMNFIQSEEDCTDSQYFLGALESCQDCPNLDKLYFSKDLVEFRHQIGRTAPLFPSDAIVNASAVDIESSSNDVLVPAVDIESSSNDVLVQEIYLVNGINRNVTVVLENIPSWLEARSTLIPERVLALGESAILQNGQQMGIQLRLLVSDTIKAGTALGTVLVRINGDLRREEDTAIRVMCDSLSSDLSFDVSLTLLPPEELNHLGRIRFAGISLMLVVWVTALGLAIWVRLNRKTRVLQVMQPHFLKVICFGKFQV